MSRKTVSHRDGGGGGGSGAWADGAFGPLISPRFAKPMAYGGMGGFGVMDGGGGKETRYYAKYSRGDGHVGGAADAGVLL